MMWMFQLFAVLLLALAVPGACIARLRADRARLQEALTEAQLDEVSGLPRLRAWRTTATERLAEIDVIVCIDVQGMRGAVGRMGGNEVLRRVGQRLTRYAGAQGIAAHRCDDEFMIALFKGPRTFSVDELVFTVCQPVTWQETTVDVAVTIGSVRNSVVDGRPRWSLATLESSAVERMWEVKRDQGIRGRRYPSFRGMAPVRAI